MELPHELQRGIQEQVETIPARDLAAAAGRLSERYRAQHGREGGSLLRGNLDVAAYVAYRLPATFAAVAATLRAVRERRPDLAPRTLLDVGGGPGTAAWAALSVWQAIERVTVLERDASMIRVGKALAARAPIPALRTATWQREDAVDPERLGEADIVVAAYMLGEVPAAERERFVERLWESVRDTCVIVEPGTPRGFDVVRQAGEVLAGAGAHLVAPFPHDWQCVESPSDWCHFSQRVSRTRLHRTVKDATLAYEDEKFSYVAASRVAGIPIAARVIRHPQVHGGHVRLVLCTPQGVRHVVVTRKDRAAFRLARDLAWGDAISLEDAALIG